MRSSMSTALVAALLLLFAACDKKKSETTQPDALATINPSDPNAISQVLVIPNGTRSNGNPPATTTSSGTPQVSGGQSSTTSSNGSTAQVPFDYNTSTNIAGCYVQVAGAGSFFTVPYGGSSGSSGQIVIPVTIPTNVSSGTFSLQYCVYNASGQVSNVLTTDVSVLRLGTGSIQVSLSWDNTPDVDLWVTDPANEQIYYGNPTSASGGALDRDDTDGYGPENIFWQNTAPDGQYKVEVDYFSGSVATNYVVTINALGQSRTYNGSLSSSSSTALVVTFTKSGNSVTFSR